MERNVFLLVLGGTLVALVVAMLIPGQPPEQPVNLPWQIETTAGGGSRVFGLTLGTSTLNEARAQFQEKAVVSLFATDAGERVVEAYFDQVTLSGIKAKVVVAAQISEQELAGMYERGVRIATLGSGTRKVTLSEQDMERAMNSPIAHITYLPRLDLSAELVEQRFGKPAETIRERENPVEHWLYPDRGLDIALHDKNKDVLQYVMPSRFEAQVRQPLLVQQAR